MFPARVLCVLIGVQLTGACGRGADTDARAPRPFVVGSVASEPASSKSPQTESAASPSNECAECAPPRYCTANTCIEPGAVVARGARGSNHGQIPPEQFRYQDMDESDELGPSGLAATDADSRLFVLDDLDRQIHVYREGVLEKVIPTPEASYGHVAVLPGSRLLLLDGYGSRNVLHVMDHDGKVVGTHPLEGKGFGKHEPPDGLHVRADGVWAMHSGTYGPGGTAVRERYMVRVFDANGEPDADRPTVSGFLSGDGRAVFRIRRTGSSLEVAARPRDGSGPERTRSIESKRPVNSITAYGSDSAGRLFVLVEVGPNEPGGERGATERLLIVVSAELELVRELELPPKTIGHEVLNPLHVSLRGFAYYLDVRENEVLVRRY